MSLFRKFRDLFDTHLLLSVITSGLLFYLLAISTGKQFSFSKEIIRVSLLSFLLLSLSFGIWPWHGSLIRLVPYYVLHLLVCWIIFLGYAIIAQCFLGL